MLLVVIALTLAMSAQTADKDAFDAIHKIGGDLRVIHAPKGDQSWAEIRDDMITNQKPAILDMEKQTERLRRIPLSKLKGANDVCAQYFWAQIVPSFYDLAHLNKRLLEFAERTPTMTPESRQDFKQLYETQRALRQRGQYIDEHDPCRDK